MQQRKPVKPVYTRGGRFTYERNYDDALNNSYALNRGSSPDISNYEWNPRNSMAFNSAKGLFNPIGENNCFLNCAVQVLWHLDVFRRNFRLLSGHICIPKSCIFCALKAIFAQYQYSERPAMPADSLRSALAQTFADQHRFQIGLMDDASECFENILLRVHFHLVCDQSEDNCSIPHCLPHQKFSMKIKEQVACECSSSSVEVMSYDQLIHYVSTTTLMTQVQRTRGQKIEGRGISFAQLLKDAKNDGDARKCSANCGRLIATRRELMNFPEVICIGFIWDSERPSFEHIRGVVNSIGTELRPKDLFDSVLNSYWANSTTHKLVGVICYYNKHYSTFFFHSKMKTWVLFDDAMIKEISTDWRAVADKCCQGHYQPLLLLYTNENTCPINTMMALQTTHLLKQMHPNNPYVPFESDGKGWKKTDSFSAYMTSSFATPSSASVIPSSISLISSFARPDEGVDGKQSLKNLTRYDDSKEENAAYCRQPSYLFAVDGDDSFYKDETYCSYLRAMNSCVLTSDNQHNMEGRGKPKTQYFNEGIKKSYDREKSQAVERFKDKSVKFSNQVVGFSATGTAESFHMSDDFSGDCTTEKVMETQRNITRTFPYVGCKKSGDLIYTEMLSHNYEPYDRQSQIARENCFQGKSQNLVTRQDIPARQEDKPSFMAVEKYGVKSEEILNWLERSKDCDSSTNGPYINTKTVQYVLSGQGMKAKHNNKTTPSETLKTNVKTLNHSMDGIVSLRRVGVNMGKGPLDDNLENDSLGSRMESGYRSCDSSGDHNSKNSVPSSPSLESGEFMLSRNVRLIARTAGSHDGFESELGSFSSSAESLSSCSSSQESGAMSRWQKSKTMETIPENLNIFHFCEYQKKEAVGKPLKTHLKREPAARVYQEEQSQTSYYNQFSNQNQPFSLSKAINRNS